MGQREDTQWGIWGAQAKGGSWTPQVCSRLGGQRTTLWVAYTTGNLFSHGLGGQSLKSRCLQGWLLLEALMEDLSHTSPGSWRCQPSLVLLDLWHITPALLLSPMASSMCASAFVSSHKDSHWI